MSYPPEEAVAELNGMRIGSAERGRRPVGNGASVDTLFSLASATMRVLPGHVDTADVPASPGLCSLAASARRTFDNPVGRYRRVVERGGGRCHGP
ncbi:hypothetical protein CLV71_11459 [Actinophytocola oryzae]|uniref:Uncharacterized protein n=1 Tax=Actinophytocola oryzae TaxID=502181 RepID=A0A4R7V5E0_9PSEU|nr:hypothetical protein CLV71_11459 [Actinophytocola oryzae]